MKKHFTLIIAPLLLIILAYVIKYYWGDFWESNDYDPDYHYLLNGLNLATGRPSFFYYHPGAPLQFYIAVSLRLMQALHGFSSSDLVYYVLSNPDRVIAFLMWPVLLFNALLLYISGRLIYAASANLPMALAVQLSPLFSSLALVFCTNHLSPESFLLTTSILLNTTLVLTLLGKIQPPKSILILSVLVGFGVSVKLLFLPFIILPLCLVSRPRQVLMIGLLILFSFVAFTIPVTSVFMGLFHLVSGLFIKHEYGLPNFHIPALTLMNMIGTLAIVIYKDMFCSVLMLCSMYLLAVRRRKLISLSAGGLHYRILLAAVCIGVANYLSPVLLLAMPHYLVPGLLLVSIYVVIILDYYAAERGSHTCRRVSLPAFIMVALICIPLTGQLPFLSSQEGLHDRAEVQKKLAGYKDYAYIYYFRSAQPFFALMTANRFTGDGKGIYSKQLAKLYPNSYLYSGFDQKYYDTDSSVDISEIIRRYNGKVLYIGTTPLHFKEILGNFEGLFGKATAPFINGKRIYEGKSESIIQYP